MIWENSSDMRITTRVNEVPDKPIRIQWRVPRYFRHVRSASMECVPSTKARTLFPFDNAKDVLENSKKDGDITQRQVSIPDVQNLNSIAGAKTVPGPNLDQSKSRNNKFGASKNTLTRRKKTDGKMEETNIPIEEMFDAQTVYPPSACVFVANLPEDHADLDLIEKVNAYFQQFGRLAVKIRRDNKNIPFAFCQYTTDEDAKAALDGGRKLVIGGRMCRTERVRSNVNFIVGRRDGNPMSKALATNLMESFGEIEAIEPLSRQIAQAVDMDGAVLVTFSRFEPNRNPHYVYRNNSEYRVELLDLKTQNHGCRTNAEEAYLAQRDIDMRSVYVGDIPPHFDESALREVMELAGPVVRVNLIRKAKPSNESASFAFVEYANEHDSQDASQSLNGTISGDYSIKVEKKAVRARLRMTKNFDVAGVAPPTGPRQMMASNARFREGPQTTGFSGRTFARGLGAATPTMSSRYRAYSGMPHNFEAMSGRQANTNLFRQFHPCPSSNRPDVLRTLSAPQSNNGHSQGMGAATLGGSLNPKVADFMPQGMGNTPASQASSLSSGATAAENTPFLRPPPPGPRAMLTAPTPRPAVNFGAFGRGPSRFERMGAHPYAQGTVGPHMASENSGDGSQFLQHYQSPMDLSMSASQIGLSVSPSPMDLSPAPRDLSPVSIDQFPAYMDEPPAYVNQLPASMGLPQRFSASTSPFAPMPSPMPFFGGDGAAPQGRPRLNSLFINSELVCPTETNRPHPGVIGQRRGPRE